MSYNGKELAVDFDYAALDPSQPEQFVSTTQASAALIAILQWMMKSESFASAGAKLHALSTALDPINSPYRSLASIALDADLTRAALSKSLLQLFDNNLIHLRMGKTKGSRQIYRQVQLELVAKGRHASQKPIGESAKCSCGYCERRRTYNKNVYRLTSQKKLQNATR
jgi:hypothetical protein